VMPGGLHAQLGEMAVRSSSGLHIEHAQEMEPVPLFVTRARSDAYAGGAGRVDGSSMSNCSPAGTKPALR
jgi:hypothetical protein